MTIRRHTLPRVAAASASLALACCSPPAPEPTPAPPAARPAAAAPAATPPASVIVPSFDSWMDAPQTAGDWSYASAGGGSLARFGTGGTGVFAIACRPAEQRVVLVRYGAPAREGPMIVRTETTDRTLTARPANGGGEAAAALQPRDPLLDAIAFSKGRFAVELAGAPALYLPSWPEVTRVIEDCR